MRLIERHNLLGLGPEARRRVADPNARDHEIGRDFGQRHEDEGPVEQFGMGQGQPFGLERDVIIGDEVDVDDPRPPPLRRLAAELDLQPLDAFEQRLGLEIRPAERAGVDEPVLVGLAPGRRCGKSGRPRSVRSPARPRARAAPGAGS